MAQPRIDIPREQIAEFCRRNHIRRLSLFGSVLCDKLLSKAEALYVAP
jgi:predicted nucleotidyltransferase